MKRLSFVTILTVLLVFSINAQVQQQATVSWISNPEYPGADPCLCVFGNTIEDITLIDYLLDLNGKEIRYLRQREEYSLNQTFAREFQRLNARFISLHIIQRRWPEGNTAITVYFIVEVYERVGNKYYLVAGNSY
jgi:hypothetical protein